MMLHRHPVWVATIEPSMGVEAKPLQLDATTSSAVAMAFLGSNSAATAQVQSAMMEQQRAIRCTQMCAIQTSRQSAMEVPSTRTIAISALWRVRLAKGFMPWLKVEYVMQVTHHVL
jgi:hypothetical protein